MKVPSEGWCGALELATARRYHPSLKRSHQYEHRHPSLPLPSSPLQGPPMGSEGKRAWVIQAPEVSLTGHTAGTQGWTVSLEG